MLIPSSVSVPHISTSSGLIQSIQTFSITIGNGQSSNTASISSVDTSCAMIVWGGETSSDSGDAAGTKVEARVTLTNSTTVTATRHTTDTNTITVNGTVVEFVSSAIQSIQYGTGTISSGSASTDAAISSVNTANAFVQYLGQSSATTANTAYNRFWSRCYFASSTAVKLKRDTSTDDVTVGFVVVEFKSGVLNSSTQRANIGLGSSDSSKTTTIISVTPSQTALFFGGHDLGNTTSSKANGRIALTDATTITADRYASGGAGSGLNIECTAVEFKASDIASIQRGTIDLNGVTSNTATISAVNTSKAFVSYLGMSTSDTSTIGTKIKNKVALTNSTTVTASAYGTPTTNTISYEVIEFV